jgi:hypothetical protein
LPEVFELFEYWDEIPPPPEMLAMIAGALGWQPNKRNPTTGKPARRGKNSLVVDSREKLEMAINQFAMFGGGTIQRGNKKKK